MGYERSVTPTVEGIDYATAMSYPATTYVQVLNTPAGPIHQLWGAGAPSTDHANAPNCSTYTDYTNSDTYVKAGAPGSGIGGSWVQT